MVNLWLEGPLLGIPNSQWKTIVGLKLLKVFNICARLGFEIPRFEIFTSTCNSMNTFCDANTNVHNCIFLQFMHLFCDAKPKKKKEKHHIAKVNLTLQLCEHLM
jgi:hypothetical protein